MQPVQLSLIPDPSGPDSGRPGAVVEQLPAEAVAAAITCWPADRQGGRTDGSR